MDVDATYFRFTSQQDQGLITEIEKHPALYYPKHADYRNLTAKEEAWKKVSAKAGRKVEDCRNRWRNVKDAYFRVKKKREDGAEAYRPKKWDAKLTFLDKCYKPYRYFREVNEQPSTASEAIDNCVEDEILDSMETSDSKDPWFSNRFTYEEDNLLVTQVSKYPALYNCRHPDNKVSHAKEKIWKDIGAIVGRSDSEVKKRFRNIRDGYLKQMKTESNNQAQKLVNCRRNRSLYEKLAFLNSSLCRRNRRIKTQDSDDNQTNEEASAEEMSEDSDSEEKNEASLNNQVVFVAALDDSFKDGDVQSDSCDEKEDVSSAPLSRRLDAGKKSKKELVASLLEELQKKMAKKDDDVDLFLKSVGIAMKKLPKPLIAEAKIKMLQLVSDLETKAMQN